METGTRDGEPCLLTTVRATDSSHMRVARLGAVSGALGLGWVGLFLFAPGYWTALGFPLDDSWIHAVYGRELARSGLLAYNPGIPAAGETSPLWGVLFALPHLVTRDPWTVVLLVKAMGFALHGVTVWLALRLAERATAARAGATGPNVAAITAAALVALHPDLLAASVSGMEIPLATTLALWVMLEALRGPSWRLAFACFLAPLGRPEVGCVGFFAVCLIVLARLAGSGDARRGSAAPDVTSRRQWARGLRLAAVVGLGTAASFALVALRTWLVTERPLPSTFYGKVTSRGLSRWYIQWVGYHDLLAQFPLVNSLFLLVPVVLFACWLLLRRRRRLASPEASTRDASASGASAPAAPTPDTAAWNVAHAELTRTDAIAGALVLIGCGFFSVSFALVAPLGPAAFYYQRYALPGLPFVLVALPLLLEIALRAVPSSRPALPRAAIIAALAVGVLAPLPGRLRHLANDARNIDDVQVAEGRALANAAPQHVVWAVDAGAIRYFGNAFVIDTLGLNTPEMLAPDRASFLQRHRPHYISVVPGLSELDPDSMRRLDVWIFKPSTRYTVTTFLPQAVHYLTRCPPQPHSGRYTVFGIHTEFTCG